MCLWLADSYTEYSGDTLVLIRVVLVSLELSLADIFVGMAMCILAC